jgi:hypothetical protein
VRKINPELWLLLILVVIAGMVHFLVASQRMALVFYFLPTLFSAYHFGRRHATLTALASVALVVLLTYTNPTMFTHRLELPFAKWFDLGVWGGVLMLAGYATGSLYERDQKTLREMQDGYDGMLVILQNFLANQKHNDSHAYRISMCATRIAEAVGLDTATVEDIRTAALLFNMKELGITNEVLCKAAQVSQDDLKQARQDRSQAVPGGSGMGASLRRSIPIFLEERQFRQSGGKPEDASFEVQILVMAEEYEALIGGHRGTKVSPAQAAQEVLKRAEKKYDSMIVNAFANLFGGQAAGAGA